MFRLMHVRFLLGYVKWRDEQGSHACTTRSLATPCKSSLEHLIFAPHVFHRQLRGGSDGEVESKTSLDTPSTMLDMCHGLID